MGEREGMALIHASSTSTSLPSSHKDASHPSSPINLFAFYVASSLSSTTHPPHAHPSPPPCMEEEEKPTNEEEVGSLPPPCSRRPRKISTPECGSGGNDRDHDNGRFRGMASILPGLDDQSASLCVAFIPRSYYGDISLASRRLRELVRSGSVYAVRRSIGVVEQWVYLFANGDPAWKAFDPRRHKWMRLPPCVAADYTFLMSDKESLSAGTHLLWLGRELAGYAAFRYDLAANGWDRGPIMKEPRCLFASASSGPYAYVAGGNCGGEALASAERYNAERSEWEQLPNMHAARQKASGCFMHGKFYVIGGRNGQHERMSSGEEYDPVTKKWTEVENMSPIPEGKEVVESSPPLVAVAKGTLFYIDSSTNVLKAFDKASNSWKHLGLVPVRADFHNGWGLAFKAMGDELYVIGGYKSVGGGEGMAMFSWNPNGQAPSWKLVTTMNLQTGNFLYNCVVMAC